MNADLVESHLNYLVAGHFVHAPVSGEPRHRLAHRGRRYLRERGLHRQGAVSESPEQPLT